MMALGVLMISALALPQPERAEQTVLNVQAAAWYVSPGGKIGLPGPYGRVMLDRLNLDSPQLSPMLDVDLDAGGWGLLLTASHVRVSGGQSAARSEIIGTMPVVFGDPLDSSLAHSSAQLLASTQLHTGALTGESRDVTLRVDGLAGVRLHDVHARIDNLHPARTAREDAALSLIEPVIGARASLGLGERVALHTTGTLGYLPNIAGMASTTTELRLSASVRLSSSATLEGGYRLLAFDLAEDAGSDQFEWKGALAGLFLGVSFEF